MEASSNFQYGFQYRLPDYYGYAQKFLHVSHPQSIWSVYRYFTDKQTETFYIQIYISIRTICLSCKAMGFATLHRTPLRNGLYLTKQHQVAASDNARQGLMCLNGKKCTFHNFVACFSCRITTKKWQYQTGFNKIRWYFNKLNH